VKWDRSGAGLDARGETAGDGGEGGGCDKYEWVEFTPWEFASSESGAAIPIWALGRRCKFSIQEQLRSRQVERFRAGFVFKTHRLLYHSTLGSKVIKKKEKYNISTGWTTKVLLPPILEGCVTNFAPHQAIKLIAWLTFEES